MNSFLMMMLLQNLFGPGAGSTDPGPIELNGRLGFGGKDYTLGLQLETQNGLNLRGRAGAGEKKYDMELRLDHRGLRLDGKRGGRTPETAPPAGSSLEEL